MAVKTPDVIHFNTDLPSADPAFITKTTQWVVTAQALLNTGRHLAMETQSSKNVYLSLRSSHTLTVCIFKSAPSLSFQSLHHLLCLS